MVPQVEKPEKENILSHHSAADVDVHHQAFNSQKVNTGIFFTSAESKFHFVPRIAGYIDNKPGFRLDHLISFVLPALMYLMTGKNVCMALKLWLISITVCSFLIGFIGTTSGHHHPKVYHEGDELQYVSQILHNFDLKSNPKYFSDLHSTSESSK